VPETIVSISMRSHCSKPHLKSVLVELACGVRSCSSEGAFRKPSLEGRRRRSRRRTGLRIAVGRWWAVSHVTLSHPPRRGTTAASRESAACAPQAILNGCRRIRRSQLGAVGRPACRCCAGQRLPVTGRGSSPRRRRTRGHHRSRRPQRSALIVVAVHRINLVFARCRLARARGSASGPSHPFSRRVRPPRVGSAAVRPRSRHGRRGGLAR
jgi:hypothetical protein